MCSLSLAGSGATVVAVHEFTLSFAFSSLRSVLVLPRTGRFKSAGGEGSSFLPAVACRVERSENCVLVPSFSRASFLRLFVGGKLLWCALSTVRWFSGWPALCCERRKLRLPSRPACAGRPFSSPRALSVGFCEWLAQDVARGFCDRHPKASLLFRFLYH